MEFLFTFEKYLNNLNEGLVKTYNIDKTYKDMNSHILWLNIKYSMVKDDVDNKIELTIDDLNITKDMDLKLNSIISYFFNLYGWFPSKMLNTNIYGLTRLQKFRKDELLLPTIVKSKITFESKFDILIDNIPKKMYHLSIQQHEVDILKKGILPKSKSKLSLHDYDGRIYLCGKILPCSNLITSMRIFYSEEKDSIIYNSKNHKKTYNKNTKWVIFEIDTNKANIKKIYKDPNYIDGYYYLDNIPKEAIKIIKKEI